MKVFRVRAGFALCLRKAEFVRRNQRVTVCAQLLKKLSQISRDDVMAALISRRRRWASRPLPLAFDAIADRGRWNSGRAHLLR